VKPFEANSTPSSRPSTTTASAPFKTSTTHPMQVDGAANSLGGSGAPKPDADTKDGDNKNAWKKMREDVATTAEVFLENRLGPHGCDGRWRRNGNRAEVSKSVCVPFGAKKESHCTRWRERASNHGTNNKPLRRKAGSGHSRAAIITTASHALTWRTSHAGRKASTKS
jgi:hypothetical protein